jgi:transposase
VQVIIRFLEKQFTKSRAVILVCLILMAGGYKNSEIQQKTGVSLPSLRKYKRALENEKIDDLFANGGKRRAARLDSDEDKIIKDFEKKPPKTLKDAKNRILKLTGKTLSLDRLRVFLKKRGLSPVQSVLHRQKQI